MNNPINAEDGLEEVFLSNGTILFKEGESSKHFYIIRSGKVEVFKRNENGEEIPLALVEEGQSLGEFAMIDQAPRSAWARCLTDVEAVKINETAYQYMLDKLPDWAFSMMQGLISRIRTTNEILARNGIVDQELLRQIASMEFNGEFTSSVNIQIDDLETEES